MITTIDHGPVRELRLSRPPVNALESGLMDALAAAVAQAPEEGARALVLSGAPGRFSGGLDIPLLLQLDRPAIRRLWESLYGVLRNLAASRIPIAAAITGHSPAGGAVLAIYCDYRIMAGGDFRIGFNEVPVGLPMPAAIHQCIALVLGPRTAERLCVTGQLMPPAEAARIGLVDEVVPPERVIERAVEWCQGLLKLPPRAMALTRQTARAGLVRRMDEGLAGELDLLMDHWFHDEAQAALRAVADRLKKK